MSIRNSDLEINNYVLTSSADVLYVIDQITSLNLSNALIHIVSFMHNTVLVQNLKREVTKAFPDAKIVLLKHSDKKKTLLNIFNLSTSVDIENISDRILEELYLASNDKDISIKEYRNQLLSRYFTDHLTNLPNLYELRKDLQYHDDFGLILIKIDNFQTINNFYGFVVGDYVIEDVGKYLKNNILNHKIYRLSGAEFAITLDNSMGFYDLKSYMTDLYSKISHIYISYQKIKIFINLTLASATSSTDNIFSKVSMALKYAQTNDLPFWIYENRMKFENEYARNLQLSSIVRYAVENSKVLPYYQAIIDNKTSKIVKYECLARLIDENKVSTK